MIDKFRDVTDENLVIQCDVFFDEKQSDEDELSTKSQSVGININNHVEVFNAVYQRVSSVCGF